MVIETPNWNRDKFGEPQEAGKQYYGRRETENIEPVVGETLDSYSRRIMAKIKKLEEINTSAHIYGRKTWFTHRTPSECWICNEINVMWMLQEQLHLVSSTIDGTQYTYQIKGKKHYWEQTSTN